MKCVFYILGGIGLIDMSVQLATAGETRVINLFLTAVFGGPS